jgi:hypothetical protein
MKMSVFLQTPPTSKGIFLEVRSLELMKKVHVLKVPEGWRVAIVSGKQTQVLENIYSDEQEAIVAAASFL